MIAMACAVLLLLVWLSPQARDLFVILGLLEDPMRNIAFGVAVYH